MKTNPVGWFEIYVKEMNRAKKFYETVFGVKLERLKGTSSEDHSEIEMWAFKGDVNSYGAPGALAKIEGCEPGNNSVLIYFSCNDCAIEEKKVKGAGGKIQKSKMSIGEYGFISIVFDTEGNMIGLHSMK
jgi:predicted enzyme related to lactoylglutathione lyase